MGLAFRGWVSRVAVGIEPGVVVEAEGLLLVPKLSSLAAWGMIALLIAVFPANIYLFQNPDILPAPPILHLLRLPLQGLLILWAYWHTKPKSQHES